MSVTGEGGVKLEKTEEKIHVVAVHLDETYTSLQTCLVFKSVELKLINKTVQLHKLCLLCLKEPYFGIGFAKNNIEYLTSILNTKSFNGKPKTAEKKKSSFQHVSIKNTAQSFTSLRKSLRESDLRI